MKKAGLFFIALSLTAALSAELYRPNRFIEYGVDVTAGASNNYFSPSDIFKETIKIDLQEIANNMPDDGLVLDTLAQANTFLNFNINEKFRLSLFAGVESTGYIDISKGLFDLLGSGYEAGQSKNIDISAYADVFATAGVSFHTTLFKKYGITITPTYVIPLAYVDKAKGTLSFSTTTEGKITAEAYAPVEVHTAVDIQRYVNNDFSTSDIMGDISNAASQGGVDIAFLVERPLLKRLDVGAYMRLPVFPARLNYSMTEAFYASFTEENLLGDLLGRTGRSTREVRWRHYEREYNSTDTKYVFRPFRLGIEGAWRPFGNWCVFRPRLGFAVRNPYSSEAIAYPEYSLDAQMALFNILGLSFGTAYENRVFVQRIGLMINARILQIDIKAMLRGANLVNSFSATGAGVSVGLRIGF